MSDQMLQTLVAGVLVGSLYGIAAMGLSIVFGVLKILNIAHGELIMIGGYLSFWMFRLYGIDPFASLLVVMGALFILGWLLHLGLFSRVIHFDEENRIKNSLLIGFGLTLVFQTLAIDLWQADERSVITDYARQSLQIGGVRLPYVRLSGLVIGILVVIGLQLFLKRTYWGKAIRATAENWQTASLTGINVRRMYLWTFSLGAALAGLAGSLVVVGFAVNPSIGLQWTLKALIVVVLAGLGSIPGTFLAGILLGLAEALGVLVFSGQYRELVSLVIFLVILMWRPQGLFAGGRNA